MHVHECTHRWKSARHTSGSSRRTSTSTPRPPGRTPDRCRLGPSGTCAATPACRGQTSQSRWVRLVGHRLLAADVDTDGRCERAGKGRVTLRRRSCARFQALLSLPGAAVDGCVLLTMLPLPLLLLLPLCVPRPSRQIGKRIPGPQAGVLDGGHPGLHSPGGARAEGLRGGMRLVVAGGESGRRSHEATVFVRTQTLHRATLEWRTRHNFHVLVCQTRPYNREGGVQGGVPCLHTGGRGPRGAGEFCESASLWFQRLAERSAVPDFPFGTR